jgi:hypothetical protein
MFCEHFNQVKSSVLMSYLLYRYMRPTTPHYILTVEDSIIHGRHLFPASSIQSTAFGIVHSFIMSAKITTPINDNLFTLLRRLMAVWYSHYNQDPGYNAARNIHVPDISTTTGLMDLMAIGNLLELAPVLDRRSYRKAGVVQAEQHEMAVARWWYRKIQVLFTTRHVTHVGGKPTAPLAIFRRSLVEFAAAIIGYKRDMDTFAPRIYGCSAVGMSRKMTDLFTANYPELLDAVEKQVDKGHGFLYWTGPAIEIRLRDHSTDKWSIYDDHDVQKTRPRLDFTDCRTFWEGPFDVWHPSPTPNFKGKQKAGASTVTAIPVPAQPKVDSSSVMNDDPRMVQDQGDVADVLNSLASDVEMTDPAADHATTSNPANDPAVPPSSTDPPFTIDPAILMGPTGSASGSVVQPLTDVPMAGTKRPAPSKFAMMFTDH